MDASNRAVQATVSGHIATRLPNGNVMVIGGSSPAVLAEIYVGDAWYDAGPAALSGTITGHTATMLGDGRYLLVAGGAVPGGEMRGEAWLFDTESAWAHVR